MTSKKKTEIEVFHNRGGEISICASWFCSESTFGVGDGKHREKHDDIVSIPYEMAGDVAALLLNVVENR